MNSTAPNPTLYIQNLNDKINKAELRRSLYHLCASYGQVIDIVTQKSANMRGQAFIVFRDIQGATNALRNINNFSFYDKPMKASYAKHKSKAYKDLEKWIQNNIAEMPFLSFLAGEKKITQAAKRTNPEEQSNDQNKRVKSQGEESANEPVKEEVMNEIQEEEPNKLLYLENLPKEINETNLSLLFSQYSGFREVRMVPGKLGIAFVEYEMEGQAMLAKEVLDGFKLTPTHAIAVSFAKKDQ